MTKNPILDELRETREQLLAEAGGTLDGLVAQLQRDERQSGRTFVQPKCRTIPNANAETAGLSPLNATTVNR